MLTLLADPLLSVVDTAFCGRLGTTALASLGACTSIFHLAFNTFRATTLATTSLVGPYYATSSAATNKNESNITMATTTTNDNNHQPTTKTGSIVEQQDATDNLATVTRLSLQFGTVLGCVTAAGLLTFTVPILHTMGIPQHSILYTPASAYLRTRAWAAPFVAFGAVATGLFRGAGTTVVPLRASLFAAVLNLVLDPLLMFGRVAAWGVQGAAAATAASQVAAAVVLLAALQRRGMVTLWRRCRPSVTTTTALERRRVYSTIAKANLSMMVRQGSLLGAWAFCTCRECVLFVPFFLVGDCCGLK